MAEHNSCLHKLLVCKSMIWVSLSSNSLDQASLVLINRQVGCLRTVEVTWASLHTFHHLKKGTGFNSTKISHNTQGLSNWRATCFLLPVPLVKENHMVYACCQFGGMAQNALMTKNDNKLRL